MLEIKELQISKDLQQSLPCAVDRLLEVTDIATSVPNSVSTSKHIINITSASQVEFMAAIMAN